MSRRCPLTLYKAFTVRSYGSHCNVRTRPVVGWLECQIVGAFLLLYVFKYGIENPEKQRDCCAAQNHLCSLFTVCTVHCRTRAVHHAVILFRTLGEHSVHAVREKMADNWYQSLARDQWRIQSSPGRRPAPLVAGTLPLHLVVIAVRQDATGTRWWCTSGSSEREAGVFSTLC